MAMTDNIPYAPLVMSQKVAPRKHTCMLHVCFLEKLTKRCEFSVKLALKKTMCASWLLPTILVRKKRTSLPISIE